jgi:hypothetical protein
LMPMARNAATWFCPAVKIGVLYLASQDRMC